MEEHRHYMRVSKSITVSFKVPNQFMISSAMTKDISCGGICMPIMQGFKPGVVLEMTFKIRELAAPITALGEIAWTGKSNNRQFPFEVGIKFIRIDPQDCEKIASHIQKDSSGVIKWLE
jgi:c-di-GMP-binding flagellar brake protein YcgR